jgi:hypothetical protein
MDKLEIFDPSTHDYSIPNMKTFVAVLLNQNELSIAMYDPTATAEDTFHFAETFLGKLFSKVGGVLAALLSPFGVAMSPLLTSILGGLLTMGGPILLFLAGTKLLGAFKGGGRSSSKSKVDIRVIGGAN